MASFAANDKVSTSSGSAEGKHGYALDEKRRAALAEVDSAKFS